MVASLQTQHRNHVYMAALRPFSAWKVLLTTTSSVVNMLLAGDRKDVGARDASSALGSSSAHKDTNGNGAAGCANCNMTCAVSPSSWYEPGGGMRSRDCRVELDGAVRRWRLAVPVLAFADAAAEATAEPGEAKAAAVAAATAGVRPAPVAAAAAPGTAGVMGDMGAMTTAGDTSREPTGIPPAEARLRGCGKEP